jgi:group I intron endonuclease
MAFVYKIVNKVNNKEYVGITRTSIDQRWASHKCAAKSRSTYLYNAMNKYGVELFSIIPLVQCTWEYACELERALIATEDYAYNISAGGEGGFVVPSEQVESWKLKLKEARKGRKPALGMKHTETTKQICAQYSNDYWATKETYDKDVITQMAFKAASKTFGISKTHYYRLKRSLSSDQ